MSISTLPAPGAWTSYRTLEGATIAEYVVEQLHGEGVDTIFGIPGGNISPFLGVLRDHPEVRFVIACHEGGAAFMADGYARASGRIGVCLVTAGPGATNALTGVASAHLDGVPLLAITGQVPTDRYGLSAIQESTDEGGVNTVEIFRHATAYTASIVDARSFERLFTRALNVAAAVPRGAVHLSFPANVSRHRLERASLTARSDGRRPAPPAAPLEEVAAAFALLREAERPLLFLGSGAREAMAAHGPELAELARRFAIPVATSVRAKGIFPEDDPFSLGVLGMAGSGHAEAYVREGVDVLMVIGSRLGEWASRSFSRHLRAARAVIQVDANPAVIGQFIPPRLPIVADAASVVAGLLARGRAETPDAREAARAARIGRLQAEVPFLADAEAARSEAFPLKPQRLMAELNRHLRGGTDVYVDMGNCTGWATHCLRVSPPVRVFTPCGLSSMGWSCGAVIGGKLARPENAAIALVGDGSFLMNGAEVNTAARYGVGAVWLVFQDDYLGMVNHGEHAQSGAHPLDDSFYSLGSPDLVAFAESLGARAHLVERAGELDALLPEVLRLADEEGRPQVIVARIDFREVPPYGDRFESVGGFDAGAGR